MIGFMKLGDKEQLTSPMNEMSSIKDDKMHVIKKRQQSNAVIDENVIGREKEIMDIESKCEALSTGNKSFSRDENNIHIEQSKIDHCNPCSNDERMDSTFNLALSSSEIDQSNLISEDKHIVSACGNSKINSSNHSKDVHYDTAEDKHKDSSLPSKMDEESDSNPNSPGTIQVHTSSLTENFQIKSGNSLKIKDEQYQSILNSAEIVRKYRSKTSEEQLDSSLNSLKIDEQYDSSLKDTIKISEYKQFDSPLNSSKTEDGHLDATLNSSVYENEPYDSTLNLEDSGQISDDDQYDLSCNSSAISGRCNAIIKDKQFVSNFNSPEAETFLSSEDEELDSSLNFPDAEESNPNIISEDEEEILAGRCNPIINDKHFVSNSNYSEMEVCKPILISDNEHLDSSLNCPDNEEANPDLISDDGEEIVPGHSNPIIKDKQFLSNLNSSDIEVYKPILVSEDEQLDSSLNCPDNEEANPDLISEDGEEIVPRHCNPIIKDKQFLSNLNSSDIEVYKPISESEDEQLDSSLNCPDIEEANPDLISKDGEKSVPGHCHSIIKDKQFLSNLNSSDIEVYKPILESEDEQLDSSLNCPDIEEASPDLVSKDGEEIVPGHCNSIIKDKQFLSNLNSSHIEVYKRILESEDERLDSLLNCPDIKEALDLISKDGKEIVPGHCNLIIKNKQFLSNLNSSEIEDKPILVSEDEQLDSLLNCPNNKEANPDMISEDGEEIVPENCNSIIKDKQFLSNLNSSDIEVYKPILVNEDEQLDSLLNCPNIKEANPDLISKDGEEIVPGNCNLIIKDKQFLSNLNSSDIEVYKHILESEDERLDSLLNCPDIKEALNVVSKDGEEIVPGHCNSIIKNKQFLSDLNSSEIEVYKPILVSEDEQLDSLLNCPNNKEANPDLISEDGEDIVPGNCNSIIKDKQFLSNLNSSDIEVYKPILVSEDEQLDSLLNCPDIEDNNPNVIDEDGVKIVPKRIIIDKQCSDLNSSGIEEELDSSLNCLVIEESNPNVISEDEEVAVPQSSSFKMCTNETDGYEKRSFPIENVCEDDKVTVADIEIKVHAGSVSKEINYTHNKNDHKESDEINYVKNNDKEMDNVGKCDKNDISWTTDLDESFDTNARSSNPSSETKVIEAIHTVIKKTLHQNESVFGCVIKVYSLLSIKDGIKRRRVYRCLRNILRRKTAGLEEGLLQKIYEIIKIIKQPIHNDYNKTKKRIVTFHSMKSNLRHFPKSKQLCMSTELRKKKRKCLQRLNRLESRKEAVISPIDNESNVGNKDTVPCDISSVIKERLLQLRNKKVSPIMNRTDLVDTIPNAKIQSADDEAGTSAPVKNTLHDIGNPSSSSEILITERTPEKRCYSDNEEFANFHTTSMDVSPSIIQVVGNYNEHYDDDEQPVKCVKSDDITKFKSLKYKQLSANNEIAAGYSSIISQTCDDNSFADSSSSNDESRGVVNKILTYLNIDLDTLQDDRASSDDKTSLQNQTSLPMKEEGESSKIGFNNLSAFTSNKLDVYLKSIGRECDDAYVRNSPERKVEPHAVKVEKVRSDLDQTTQRLKLPVKPKTVAEMRRLLDEQKINEFRANLKLKSRPVVLRRLQPESYSDKSGEDVNSKLSNPNASFNRRSWKNLTKLQNDKRFSKQYIQCEGQNIRLVGSIGSDTEYIKLPKLEVKPIPKVTTQPKRYSKFLNKYDKPCLLYDTELKDTKSKYKPGPLSKKYKLQWMKSTSSNILEPVIMPKISIEVFPKIGRELEDIPKRYLKLFQDHNKVIDENWAKFAASVVVNDPEPLNTSNYDTKATESTNSGSFTFVLPYKNDQNRVLMAKEDTNPVQTVSNVVNTVQSDILKDDKETVSQMLQDMFNCVENSLIENSIIKEDPECNYSEPVGANSADSNKTKKRKLLNVDNTTGIKRHKLSRRNMELKRLDVTVLDVNAVTSEPCTNESCYLGCVCDSLECNEPQKEHCSQEQCMFECRCSYSQRLRFKGNELISKEVIKLKDKAARGLARVEREFKQTVFVKDDTAFLVDNSNNERKRRNVKAPKRYEDFVQSDEAITFNGSNGRYELSPKKIEPPKEDTKELYKLLLKPVISKPSVIPIISKSPVKEDVEIPVDKLSLKPTVDLVKLGLIDVEPWCMIHCLYKCFCKNKDTEGDVFSVEEWEKNKKIITRKLTDFGSDLLHSSIKRSRPLSYIDKPKPLCKKLKILRDTILIGSSSSDDDVLPEQDPLAVSPKPKLRVRSDSLKYVDLTKPLDRQDSLNLLQEIKYKPRNRRRPIRSPNKVVKQSPVQNIDENSLLNEFAMSTKKVIQDIPLDVVTLEKTPVHPEEEFDYNKTTNQKGVLNNKLETKIISFGDFPSSILYVNTCARTEAFSRKSLKRKIKYNKRNAKEVRRQIKGQDPFLQNLLDNLINTSLDYVDPFRPKTKREERNMRIREKRRLKKLNIEQTPAALIKGQQLIKQEVLSENEEKNDSVPDQKKQTVTPSYKKYVNNISSNYFGKETVKPDETKTRRPNTILLKFEEMLANQSKSALEFAMTKPVPNQLRFVQWSTVLSKYLTRDFFLWIDTAEQLKTRIFLTYDEIAPNSNCTNIRDILLNPSVFINKPIVRKILRDLSSYRLNETDNEYLVLRGQPTCWSAVTFLTRPCETKNSNSIPDNLNERNSSATRASIDKRSSPTSVPVIKQEPVEIDNAICKSRLEMGARNSKHGELEMQHNLEADVQNFLTGGKPQLLAPLPYKINTRWLMLPIENNFTVLSIAKFNCNIKYDHIQQAVNISVQNQTTVRLPTFGKTKPSGVLPLFGIYIIPNAPKHAFIGPYEMNEPSGLTKYRMYNGNLVNVQDYERFVENGEPKPIGTWLSCNEISNVNSRTVVRDKNGITLPDVIRTIEFNPAIYADLRSRRTHPHLISPPPPEMEAENNKCEEEKPCDIEKKISDVSDLSLPLKIHLGDAEDEIPATTIIPLNRTTAEDNKTKCMKRKSDSNIISPDKVIKTELKKPMAGMVSLLKKNLHKSTNKEIDSPPKCEKQTVTIDTENGPKEVKVVVMTGEQKAKLPKLTVKPFNILKSQISELNKAGQMPKLVDFNQFKLCMQSAGLKTPNGKSLLRIASKITPPEGSEVQPSVAQICPNLTPINKELNIGSESSDTVSPSSIAAESPSASPDISLTIKEVKIKTNAAKLLKLQEISPDCIDSKTLLNASENRQKITISMKDLKKPMGKKELFKINTTCPKDLEKQLQNKKSVLKIIPASEKYISIKPQVIVLNQKSLASAGTVKPDTPNQKSLASAGTVKPDTPKELSAVEVVRPRSRLDSDSSVIEVPPNDNIDIIEISDSDDEKSEKKKTTTSSGWSSFKRVKYPQIDQTVKIIENYINSSKMMTIVKPNSARNSLKGDKSGLAWLVSNVEEIGFLVVKLRPDKKISFTLPLVPRNVEFANAQIASLFLNKLIEKVVSFVPANLTLVWNLQTDARHVLHLKPFNEEILMGYHVLTRAGLLDITQNSFPNLPQEASQAVQSAVVKAFLRMLNRTLYLPDVERFNCQSVLKILEKSSDEIRMELEREVNFRKQKMLLIKERARLMMQVKALNGVNTITTKQDAAKQGDRSKVVVIDE